MSDRFIERVVAGLICCLISLPRLTAGCELDNAGVPQVIPGPSVPSPVPLHAPVRLGTRVKSSSSGPGTSSRAARSRLTARIRTARLPFSSRAPPASMMMLRGPDIDPPAQAIRAVRIRYQWFPASPSTRFLCRYRSMPTNSPAADVQPRALATLRAGSGWQEIEFRPFTTLDVRYVYFLTYAQGRVC